MKTKLSNLAYCVLLSFMIITPSCTSTSPVSNTQDKKPGSSTTTTTNSSSVVPSTAPAKPTDGITLDLTGGKINIGGQIVDSASGNVINQKIKVTISGTGSSSVESTEFTSPTGLFNFALKKGTPLSVEKPLSLTVVAHVDGYFSSSLPLQITDANAASVIIKMVNFSTPPVGVATVQDIKGKTSPSGALQSDLTVKANEGQTKTTSSITLPANTVIKDREGNALSGDIKVNLASFNNQSQSSTTSFPGGFASTVDINGKDQPGLFTTGGFVSIDITDSSGKLASNFSNPVNVTMQVPKSTLNPETGKLIQQGDSIGIWSHDTVTGKWKSEGIGTVSTPDANGNLTVNYQVSHLSYWNLDWFDNNTCSFKLKIKWKDNKSYYPLTLKTLFDGQESQSWTHPGHINEDDNQLYNFPTDRDITFVGLVGDDKGLEIARQKLRLKLKANQQGTCEDVDLNIDSTNIKLPKIFKVPMNIGFKIKNSFTAAEINAFLSLIFGGGELEKVLKVTHPSDKNAKFSFSDKAFNDLLVGGVSATVVDNLKLQMKQKFYPSIPFWYRNVTRNETNWTYGYLFYGSEFQFFEDEKYEFKVLYKGEEYLKQFTVNESTKALIINDIELPISAVSAANSGLIGS